MEQKFSDVYRTSFLTLDRYLQQSNSAQFYFRPLLPPLNTVSGEFYSLSPAQGTDPSIRINKYSSNGTFLGFGYLYDTSFNVPPGGGGGDVSGGYWTLTGSNIYNNNPGFVGVGTPSPSSALDVSGIVHIGNGGKKSLLIGNPISDIWYEDDVQIINAQGDREASIILGCDGSGALRFVNANSQTYIQSGLDISNNSGCKMNFTQFASQVQTMTIDTSYQYVYIGTDLGNTYNGNQLFVDGSAEIHQLTVSSPYSNPLLLSDIRANPLPSQLIIQSAIAAGPEKGGLLKIGAYRTEGVGTAGVIQSTNTFPDVSGGSSVDHGRPLLLNPSGGIVRINSQNTDIFSSAVLEVSGTTKMFGNLDISAGVLRISGSGGNGANINGTATFSGPVGINKNPPTVQLDVLGDIKAGNVLPQTSNAYDLGSSSAYWRDLYLSTGTIYMGPTATIGADGSGNVLVNKSSGYGLGVGVTRPATSLEVSGQTTLTQDIAYENRSVNPLPSQLIVRGYNASNRLVVGSYYTGGVGTAASLQASDYYGGLDHGTNILLNPLGGYVGIGLPTPGVVLDVSGGIRASANITAPQAIASSLAVGSRIYNTFQYISSSSSSVSFSSLNITALPYSVYLVTVEASVVTALTGPSAICVCEVDISNNVDPQIEKTYVVSSGTTTSLTSTGASFTSTTPINKGNGSITVNITLTGGGTFSIPSYIYLNIIGLC